MTRTPLRLALTCACAGLLLAACADKTARPSGGTGTTTATSQAAKATTTTKTTSTTKSTKATTATKEKLPDNTGIPSCDDYLASYVACHQTAKIYAPDQIEERYQMMRTSLLRDSLDPDIRPQLDARCVSLSSQLRQALHGQSCNAAPTAPAAPAK